MRRQFVLCLLHANSGIQGPDSNSVRYKHQQSQSRYFGAVRIPLFSKGDQEKIAAVLYAIDAKIDCNNRINAGLKAMAKTIYDYWFVQFDFPNADKKPYKSSGGKMVYNATLKRDIPAGWKDRRLSQIANITMGQSPEGDSLNETGEGIEFFQGSSDFGWQLPAVRQYTTQPTRMAKCGDILLSVRAPVGDMNIANRHCCIGRGLAALNSKEKFDGFLFYVMHYFKQVFDRRNGEGTTFGSITKEDLHSLPLAYPPTELLKEYDQIVSIYNSMVSTRSTEELGAYGTTRLAATYANEWSSHCRFIASGLRLENRLGY